MAMRVEAGTARASCAVATVIAMLVSSGCGTLGNEIEQPAPDRVQREIAVKQALIAAPSVGAAPIAVLVDEDGTVTLDGIVDGDAERREALRIAREALDGDEPIDALRVRD